MHSEASGFLLININCEEYIFPNKHGWCDIWKAISDINKQGTHLNMFSALSA